MLHQYDCAAIYILTHIKPYLIPYGHTLVYMTANEDDVKQLLETVQTLSDTLRMVLSDEDTYHSMRKTLGFVD
jgi:hypothetical protein